MALENNQIEEILKGKFADNVADFKEEDIFTFEADSDIILELITLLNADGVLNFNFLTDICGIHYPDNAKEKQFAVVYQLHNWVDNKRIRIKTYLSEDKLELDSVTSIFNAANWMERETYDFYGIRFAGHPNLTRILNDLNMKEHPMRKEFPMEDSQRTDKDDRFFGRTTNNNQSNS